MTFDLFDDRKKKAACWRLVDHDDPLAQVVAHIYRDDIATLLKAAPDLLEACKLALEYSVNATTYPDGPCLDSDIRDHLRGAIARAEEVQ